MDLTAVGVDIGGTNVKLGVVDRRGRVRFARTFSTRSAGTRTAFLTRLVREIRDLIREAGQKGSRVAGIGIGAPGPIDVERGFVYFFPNIPGWRNTPLKKILEKRLKKKVFVDNDANVMALAEFLYGAGRSSKSLIALTLGTGIGGGLVLDGRLYHGASFSAAEIGHLVIHEDGPRCACGNRGCVEAYVGNGYFVRQIRRRLQEGRKSLLSRWLKNPSVELTPELVAKAARAGDRFSIECWRECAEHLGTALAGLANILNPERIVIGGGIAQAGPLLFRPLRRTLKKKAFPIASASVKVVPASLGQEAGLVGAAALVFQAK